MPPLPAVLRILAVVIIAVAGLHLVFGMHAESLLGAVLPAQVAADPTLNSQNRFYGVAFAFHGVALWICAGDIPRFRPILLALLWVFFMAGLARLVAWALHGAPAPAVVGLLLLELLLPPVLLAWLRRVPQR